MKASRYTMFVCLCSIFTRTAVVFGAVESLTNSIDDLYKPRNGYSQPPNLFSVGFPLVPSEGPTLVIRPILPAPQRPIRDGQLVHAYYSTLRQYRFKRAGQQIRRINYWVDDEIPQDDPTLPKMITTVQPAASEIQPLTTYLVAWSMLAMAHWRIGAPGTGGKDWSAPHCVIYLKGQPLATVATDPRVPLQSARNNDTLAKNDTIQAMGAPSNRGSITANVYPRPAMMSRLDVLYLLLAPLDFSLGHAEEDHVVLPDNITFFDSRPYKHGIARLNITKFPEPGPVAWDDITLGCMYLMRKLAGEGDYGTLESQFMRDGVPFATVELLYNELRDAASGLVIPIQTSSHIAA